jgi:hypothetical protein
MVRSLAIARSVLAESIIPEQARSMSQRYRFGVQYPATGWGWLEDTHEIAVVVRGKGYTETKSGDRYDLKAGDVVHIEPGERFRWGGNFDMIVSCSPAFDPAKHHLED